MEPNLKPCQADANNTLKEYQSTLEKNVEAEGNGQENSASLGQVIQKSDMQKNCALQEDESFQTQPHLSHRGFDTSQSPEKVSDGSARSNKELTSVEDQGQNDSIKMVETCQEESSALPLSKQKSSMSVENHSATEIEKSILSPEEGSPSPDVVETHVILPERSIQFPGLFANLMQAVKQTEDKSVGLKSVKQTTEDTSNSQELGVNTQSEPKIKNATENMNLKSQSNSKPSGRSFHTNNRQVLKRVWQKGRCTESNNSSMCSEESELTVYKKMKFRRSSAPDLNNETEALLVKCPSPESNSCPSLPSDREYFCQDLQNDSKKSHLSSSMSEESELNLQVQSLREDKESFVKENMCSGDQTSIASNEECPTIASLIAANLAADKEHSSSSSPRLDSNGESFLEPVANCDPKHGCQESESVQRPVSPSYNDSDRFIPSLPGTSKDKNVYSEKPMVVDKATGRLILKVRKHNQPRMKATKLPPLKDSTIESQENESDKSEDHFVRRSLRERKVVHRDENEVTEIDELMSEDDEEYHVEQDSDAYSSDSDVGRGEGSDHSQPKKMKKTRSAPDPTAFNVKLKGKYKCWLCRKVFLKCGFAKSHVLKKHTEKGLCAVDLGQSEYLGTPQLLLFCPKKCRYATLSMEGLKNHITTCEKEILCPVEVAEKFLETDYDELQKMGEKVLEIPEKKVRAPKKPQAKKSVPPEEKVENGAAEKLEESANKNNSLMMNQAPTGQALENPEFQNFVSQKEQSFESTPLPVIPSANDEYEVVDVDLECIEQPGENKVAEQEQPRLPYSEPQQQTVPFQQQQHFHPPTPNVFQDSTVRPAQVHNSGFSSPQATRPRMNMPRQAFTGSVSNRGIRPPHPELVSNVASPVRGHVPVQPQSPMPSNLNPQSSSRPSFQPRPNLQQPVRFRQRVPQNSPNPSLPMQRTLQQTPRLPSGISSRGAHVASPYPQQTFARPPRQHLPQRQPGFPPQRFGPRQPAGAQIRPQVMNSPRGRGQVPRQQYPRQQLQHRGGGFSQTNHYPQQGAVPHGVSRNRNLDLAQDQDDAYTITETGVICLD
ncbi:hypothetical protein EGW08_017012 [Elysia chlorotica]|uniref:C2H2-type domain-containing protein n=1 Tax=Elysia chlorotica TaxID=188477 RepID=A0A3S0ZDL4_ELYCH|nr:hypothetical protein EGW08_017012 [Elysia chlorotica]